MSQRLRSRSRIPSTSQVRAPYGARPPIDGSARAVPRRIDPSPRVGDEEFIRIAQVGGTFSCPSMVGGTFTMTFQPPTTAQEAEHRRDLARMYIEISVVYDLVGLIPPHPVRTAAEELLINISCLLMESLRSFITSSERRQDCPHRYNAAYNEV